MKEERRRMKQTEEKNIYQLKISLKYTRPIIWRRIQLYGDVTLAKLHRILQSAISWVRFSPASVHCWQNVLWSPEPR
jgi:pRiA4b ORF-3-like protein